MNENWYVVYSRSTGEAFSIGTILANPMPEEFDVFQIPENIVESFLIGESVWDSQTRNII